MGKRHHLFVGITAELVADHLQLGIEPGRAKGRAAVVVAHQGHQSGAGGGRVALRHQAECSLARLGLDPEVREARQLSLAHRDAAMDLVQIFAKADLQDQRLDLAKAARLGQPPGPGVQLAQPLGIGRKPRQRMGRELMGLQRRAADLAIHRHKAAQRLARAGKDRLDLGHGRRRQAGQIRQRNRRFKALSIMGHHRRLRQILHLHWVTCLQLQRNKVSPETLPANFNVALIYETPMTEPAAPGMKKGEGCPSPSPNILGGSGGRSAPGLCQPIAAAFTSSSIWATYCSKFFENISTSFLACTS